MLARIRELTAYLPPVLAVLLLVMAGAPSRAVAQATEARMALVIGNSAYRSVDPLPNPVRDARLIANKLTAVGFKVTLLLDVDQLAMKRAMVEFGRALRASDAVGLFYYAGHGLQVNGLNYLVPVEANVRDETEVGIETVSLSDLLSTMDRARSRINIVVLDACRNNPFAKTFQSDAAGLARVDAPAGTIVGYATAPGSVASDGSGDNSPFTRALASAMLQPGLPIEQTFKEVRRAVLAETQGQQVPWETSSISGDFYFVRGAGPAHRPAPSGEDAAGDKALELAFWNAVKGSTNPALFRSYLEQYPRGAFVPIARAKIEELQHSAAARPQIPALPPQDGVAAGGPPVMFADSGRRSLGEEEVDSLSCEQLWVARNEMFARNGYCFGTPEGQSVFGTQGCRTTRQDILSPIEMQNLRVIRSVERRKSCGPLSRQALASPAPRPAEAQRVTWHYVTGLDPKGDNFLALKVAPSLRAERIEKMGPNTLLKVLGSQGPWRRVQLQDGRTGWAHSRYIACCKRGP